MEPVLDDNEPPVATAREPNRKVQSIELAIFLLLILPPMGASYLIVSHASPSFVGAAIMSIFSDFGLVGLVLYFLWRNREPRSRIGWTTANLGLEISIGLLLFVPVALGINFLEQTLHAAGLSAPSKVPSFLAASGPGGIVLAFILVVVVAIAEETIFRGYLIQRLITVTRSPGAAVLLSSAIFAMGHGYEGTAGLLSVFVLGVILALVYRWRGSLVAPMVMHFLTDFVSIVLVAIVHTYSR